MNDRSALEHHPELAQLWTLHYAGRMAIRSLECARTGGPPLLVGPAVAELRTAIDGVLGAVERYRDAVQFHRSLEVQVWIPETWSVEQADALMELVCDMADRVWRSEQVTRSR